MNLQLNTSSLDNILKNTSEVSECKCENVSLAIEPFYSFIEFLFLA